MFGKSVLTHGALDITITKITMPQFAKFFRFSMLMLLLIQYMDSSRLNLFAREFPSLTGMIFLNGER